MTESATGTCVRMDAHHVEITRTHNEDPSVPDAIHLRCTCGWTSSAPDADSVDELVREHEQLGAPAPPPSTVSPD